jgi:hypothetical protein
VVDVLRFDCKFYVFTILCQSAFGRGTEIIRFNLTKGEKSSKKEENFEKERKKNI